MAPTRSITLAFTGASGMPYAFRLLECLLTAGARVQLLYSSAAQIVAKQECAVALPSQPREAVRALGERFGARKDQLVVYARDDWLAPGFYMKPQTIEDLVDFVVARVLDHLGVEHELVRRWGEARDIPGPTTESA
jgi:3-polyprenyl-4-hydroxybenzoate decarboxylase